MTDLAQLGSAGSCKCAVAGQSAARTALVRELLTGSCMAKRKSERVGPAFERSMARVPWSCAPDLDRAIQSIVQRWVAPPLIATCIACGSSHTSSDTDPNRPIAGVSGGAGTGAGGTGVASGGMGPTAGVVAGTGGPPSDDPLADFAPDLPAEDSDFLPMHCDPGWNPMPFVTPAETWDHWALRGVGDNQQMSWVVSESGKPCAGASDVDACESALEAQPEFLTRTRCGMAGCTSYWVAASRGDEVRLFGSRHDLVRFLGEIDSPEDALLLVYYDGYEPGHAIASDVCQSAAVREVEDGFEVYAHRNTSDCAPIRTTRYLLHVGRDGVVQVLREGIGSEAGGCAGRRPEGLHTHDVYAASELGAFLAHSAQLEAASVHAFERMLLELRAHGAPADLIARAQAARDDEIRHTRQVDSLARRFGGRVAPVEVAPLAPRSVLAMALENVVEGCVRETWGALVGSYQAAHASDPDIARAMAEIAGDERRHAELSWRLGAWLDARLTAQERAEVERAYREAIAELRRQSDAPLADELVHIAGLPDRATAHALLDELGARVFATA